MVEDLDKIEDLDRKVTQSLAKTNRILYTLLARMTRKKKTRYQGLNNSSKRLKKHRKARREQPRNVTPNAPTGSKKDRKNAGQDQC